MKYFAKVENEETKVCSVGLGTDGEYYRSIGMTEQDVELGFDGNYYLSGYAPTKPEEMIKKERIEELQNYLNATDWYAIRYSETGVSIPSDIQEQRRRAREEISRLRGDNDQNTDGGFVGD